MKLSQRIDEGNGERGWEQCQLLEEGQVLVVPRLPFDLEDDERAFLLTVPLAASHKNIAYDPQRHRVTGFVERRSGDREKVRAIMQAYSQRVTAFLASMLPQYARSWVVSYASFRPQEEEGRRLPWRARNDLLHTDAFPSRPTNGDRILRVFTNINPTEARCWVTSDTFDVLLKRFAGSPALPLPAPQRRRGWIATLARAARIPLPYRSPYDQFMLRFHNYLKAHQEFQATGRRQVWEFPPNSTWVLFTDFVPHAALSGRYALEQTFIVAHDSLVLPERAPLRILERLCDAQLTEARRDAAV